MEKNSFLLINEIVYDIYQWDSLTSIKEHFFPHLKALIPFSYASILLKDKKSDITSINYSSIICYPEYFEEAERNYLKFVQDDPLDWTIHVNESQVLKESDLIEEEKRLNSPIYKHCYHKYSIHDTLQYTIVYNQKYLGVLTLFRTKIDGIFSDDSMFYLRSLGKHLNVALYRLLEKATNYPDHQILLSTLKKTHHLTDRECQVLNQIYNYLNNDVIAEMLDITENTLMKHIQNIYRKVGVSSKWELLQFKNQ